MTTNNKKTQWQRYVDDALLMTQQVTMAAIHGLDGTRWATSENFNVRYHGNQQNGVYLS